MLWGNWVISKVSPRLSSRGSLGNIVSIGIHIPTSPSRVEIKVHKHKHFAWVSGHPSFGYSLPLRSNSCLLTVINSLPVQLFASPWSVYPFFSSRRLRTWHTLRNILHHYCCYNKLRQAWWLKITWTIGLDVKSLKMVLMELKWRCWQDWTPPGARGDCVPRLCQLL